MYTHINLKCKCGRSDCDMLGPDENTGKLLKALNKFLQYIKRETKEAHMPTISSGYRCEYHNKKVGGVPSSQHRKGLAADLHCATLSAETLFILAKKSKLFDGIGVYSWGIHVDKRGTAARWDKRSPNRKKKLLIELY